MKIIPSYTKVLTLGSAYTQDALTGDVVIQEKVDGSQFRFGINENGVLVGGSKSAIFDFDAPDNMFKKGIEYLQTIKHVIEGFPNDTYFYGEYLQKPKHNVLKYANVPKNNIVLFDALIGGQWVSRKELEALAIDFDIDLIPELYSGPATTLTIKDLLGTKSYLGDETIEGVVIKNYSQTILLGGMVFPLFTKYVRESFKERHEVEWKVKKPKDSIDLYLQSFRAEPRWQKALGYLRDSGKLENQPKDIAQLIKRVNADIVEEEAENIKNDLYKMAIPEILRVATRGLPEWYKQKLLENLN